MNKEFIFILWAKWHVANFDMPMWCQFRWHMSSSNLIDLMTLTWNLPLNFDVAFCNWLDKFLPPTNAPSRLVHVHNFECEKWAESRLAWCFVYTILLVSGSKLFPWIQTIRFFFFFFFKCPTRSYGSSGSIHAPIYTRHARVEFGLFAQGIFFTSLSCHVFM